MPPPSSHANYRKPDSRQSDLVRLPDIAPTRDTDVNLLLSFIYSYILGAPARSRSDHKMLIFRRDHNDCPPAGRGLSDKPRTAGCSVASLDLRIFFFRPSAVVGNPKRVLLNSPGRVPPPSDLNPGFRRERAANMSRPIHDSATASSASDGNQIDPSPSSENGSPILGRLDGLQGLVAPEVLQGSHTPPEVGLGCVPRERSSRSTHSPRAALLYLGYGIVRCTARS